MAPIVSDIWEQTRLAARALVEFGEHLLSPTVRLGVSGLSRSGKTVFITALLHSLLRGGRLPVFEPMASGRIARVHLAPQPDDAVPRFDYERHVSSLVRDREWPESTRQISELRLVIEYQAAAGAMRRLTLDIVDYPGEWLLDLPLLNKSYEQWSAETLAHLRRTARAPLPRAFLDFVESIDGAAAANEQAAIEAARLFTAHLQACREQHHTFSMVAPGRFLMPGDLAGSPALTFAPLVLPDGDDAPPGSIWEMMRRRYDAYRDVVVRPFFRDHFARLDRQIVLVDLLSALSAGPEAVNDLQDAMAAVLECFRIGRGGWLNTLFRPRADRILFAATKADQLHHSAHDHLEIMLKRMVDSAIARAGHAGAEVDVIALAAVRATKEAMLRTDAGTLPSIVGTPAQGEWNDEKATNSKRDVAVFPGDLPAEILQGSDFRAIQFRPPALEGGVDGIPALPHIRLDRAMQFLIGDRLR